MVNDLPWYKESRGVSRENNVREAALYKLPCVCAALPACAMEMSKSMRNSGACALPCPMSNTLLSTHLVCCTRLSYISLDEESPLTQSIDDLPRQLLSSL